MIAWLAVVLGINSTRNAGNFLVYVIAWEGVKFGINFTSCSENSNEIARGAAECYVVIATTSGIYPKISLLGVYHKLIPTHKDFD